MFSEAIWLTYTGGQKEWCIDFKVQLWQHFLVKKDHQWQFWKIQDVRISKLSLDVQFHAFMAEILEVKVSYPKLSFTMK